jgi:hypothetical protein
MMIAANLARLSPVSCFVRPMAEISQNGWIQYQNFSEEVIHFQQELNEQVYNKFRIFIKKGGAGNRNFEANLTAPAPKLQYSRVRFEAIMKNILPDFVLLIIYNLVFFTAAFVGFLRYDAR